MDRAGPMVWRVDRSLEADLHHRLESCLAGICGELRSGNDNWIHFSDAAPDQHDGRDGAAENSRGPCHLGRLDGVCAARRPLDDGHHSLEEMIHGPAGGRTHRESNIPTQTTRKGPRTIRVLPRTDFGDDTRGLRGDGLL